MKKERVPSDPLFFLTIDCHPSHIFIERGYDNEAFIENHAIHHCSVSFGGRSSLHGSHL